MQGRPAPEHSRRCGRWCAACALLQLLPSTLARCLSLSLVVLSCKRVPLFGPPASHSHTSVSHAFCGLEEVARLAGKLAARVFTRMALIPEYVNNSIVVAREVVSRSHDRLVYNGTPATSVGRTVTRTGDKALRWEQQQLEPLLMTI